MLSPTVLSRRALVTVAVSVCLLVGVAAPAQAGVRTAQKKSFSSHGKKGSVVRYVDDSGSKDTHYLKMTADDSGGKSNRCTETWIDLSTKNPHKHFNPGVLVNCTGKSKTLPKVYVTDWVGVRGVGLIVCDVPNTSGRIVRNSSNCNGNLGSMYLWSGRTYKSIDSPGISTPNGVKVWIFR